MEKFAKVINASLFHAPVYGSIEYLDHHLLVIDDKGLIQEVLSPTSPLYDATIEKAKADHCYTKIKDGSYLLPGFTDLHVHAPQWPQIGVALDQPLDVWLAECTFPLEAKYADVAFAKTVYKDLVHQLLSRGTTTVLYFGSLHNAGNLELVKACLKQGQRGFVGTVVMDKKDTNPDFYRDESTQAALQKTEEFIQTVRALGKEALQGVYPVVTPRFVPSCTDEALTGLSQLAKKYDTYIQSHCSEGDWEYTHVHDRFKMKDADVLNKFGLLGNKSIMAHCDFLDEADGETFAKTKTAIAHCPLSNSYFANGVLPVKRLHEQGVTIGLGTDISAGFSPSIYDNLKQAVISSRMLEDGVDTSLLAKNRGVADSRISVNEAFYLATVGGGQALNIPLGLFQKGQIADFQVVDTTIAGNPIPDFSLFNSEEDTLQRLLYLATSENIREVWVQGKKVIDKLEKLR